MSTMYKKLKECSMKKKKAKPFPKIIYGRWETYGFTYDENLGYIVSPNKEAKVAIYKLDDIVTATNTTKLSK